jgi:hypothetical protein
MITLYLRNDLGIYTGSVEVDKYQSIPALSTTICPPELIGSQVAQWNGNGWDILEEHPPLRLPNQEEILAQKIAQEKQWRDSELERTDKFATIKDMPYYYAHISYRQALRDYPNTVDFPNGERPTLDKTIKNALTKYQFMSRFSATERITLEQASTQSAELADWITLFKLTEEINLNDPITIAGVQMLEQAGIIGVGRTNEILS